MELLADQLWNLHLELLFTWHLKVFLYSISHSTNSTWITGIHPHSHCRKHTASPLSSSRQHPSYDGCLEVRGEIIRTVLLYCVLKLCAVISTLRWAVRTVLWIGFCHTGHISLCIDLCVFICVFLFHTANLLYYCEHGGVNLMGLKPGPYDLSSFSTLTLLVGSFKPQIPVPAMTNNVFGGTLNLAPSIYLYGALLCIFLKYSKYSMFVVHQSEFMWWKYAV